MTGVITPLVQEAQSKKRWIKAVLLYAVGTVTSSMALGFVLGQLGLVVQHIATMEWRAMTLLVVGTTFALMDLGYVPPGKTPTLRRQTSQAWARRFRGGLRWLLWGLDLGVGFTTIRLSSLYWSVIATVVLLVPPSAAPLAMGAYGFSLALSLMIVVANAQRRRRIHNPGATSLRISPQVSRASAMLLVAFVVAEFVITITI